jgi:hypothetical protein
MRVCRVQQVIADLAGIDAETVRNDRVPAYRSWYGERQERGRDSRKGIGRLGELGQRKSLQI